MMDDMNVMDCFALLGLLQVDVLVCLKDDDETFKQAREKIMLHIDKLAKCTKVAIDKIIENEEKGIVIG